MARADVYRIAFENQRWTLYKAHGYKPILHAETHDELINHVLTLTRGKGVIVRFASEAGVRELRLGEVETDES
ncbi:hypothetical protein PflQ2_1763 [Pseudomonas fluorescens Q2-87]|uniref:DUF2188 domain-containing protein n=1 Tax=Pseudomonas fluorescens (strain Q2-87) TaxID=1038922 RepID=J2MSN8_PSEFQ|nr:hypothetical protein PflQ2_1763 [Pseudomonas fluorescens Q2-87]